MPTPSKNQQKRDWHTANRKLLAEHHGSVALAKTLHEGAELSRLITDTTAYIKQVYVDGTVEFEAGGKTYVARVALKEDAPPTADPMPAKP